MLVSTAHKRYRIVIEMFLVGEYIISLFRLNKIHCTVALWKIIPEMNSNCDVTNSKAHLSQSTVP